MSHRPEQNLAKSLFQAGCALSALVLLLPLFVLILLAFLAALFT